MLRQDKNLPEVRLGVFVAVNINIDGYTTHRWDYLHSKTLTNTVDGPDLGRIMPTEARKSRCQPSLHLTHPRRHLQDERKKGRVRADVFTAKIGACPPGIRVHVSTAGFTPVTRLSCMSGLSAHNHCDVRWIFTGFSSCAARGRRENVKRISKRFYYKSHTKEKHGWHVNNV